MGVYLTDPDHFLTICMSIAASKQPQTYFCYPFCQEIGHLAHFANYWAWGTILIGLVS